MAARTFRAWINRTRGNEHARVFDFEAEEAGAAFDIAKAELKRGETLEQVSEIHLEGPPPTADDARLLEVLAENERLRAELALALGRPSR